MAVLFRTLATWWRAASRFVEAHRLLMRYLYFVSLFLLIGAFLLSTGGQLKLAGWSPNYALFGVSLLLVSLAVLSLAFWWVFSLRFLGEHIGMVAGVRIWVFAQLAKYLPGGIWNYASRVYACDQVGVSRRNAALSLGLEAILRVLAAVIVFLLSVPFWPIGTRLPVTALSLVGILAVGFTALHPRVIEWGMNRVTKILRRAPVSLPSLGYAPMLRLLTGHTLTVIGVGGAFYLMLASLYRAPVNIAIPVTGMLAISVISGFLNPLTPNGLGTREGMLIAFLSYYLPLPLATTAALLSRLWLTASELVGVALVVIVSRLLGAKSRPVHPDRA